MKLDEMTLDVNQNIEIKAAIGDVFRSMLHRFGEGFSNPKGESLQMILEQWPGGRWFRDRGDGIGHLWGHVQVIKPPVLLELSGPMFMSYPAINHLEVKLEEIAGGTRLGLRHRAIGFIDPAHREGVSSGWQHILNAIAENCAAKSAGQRA
ncbi:MAG TPA: SRPBCC domain-containing protein [Verrucomicrobiae bacterium]|nr:SRPBCC domain-containing protein [Verrucomicrobiae bacterium]